MGLSGILHTQAAQVVEAYTALFDAVQVERQEGEWVLITGVRNGRVWSES